MVTTARGVTPVNVYKPHCVFRNGEWQVTAFNRSKNHVPTGLSWRWYVAHRVAREVNARIKDKK